jgi:hypothetical protein
MVAQPAVEQVYHADVSRIASSPQHHFRNTEYGMLDSAYKNI